MLRLKWNYSIYLAVSHGAENTLKSTEKKRNKAVQDTEYANRSQQSKPRNHNNNQQCRIPENVLLKRKCKSLST